MYIVYAIEKLLIFSLRWKPIVRIWDVSWSALGFDWVQVLVLSLVGLLYSNTVPTLSLSYSFLFWKSGTNYQSHLVPKLRSYHSHRIHNCILIIVLTPCRNVRIWGIIFIIIERKKWDKYVHERLTHCLEQNIINT